MHDTVNNPHSWAADRPFGLALEWMDETLADVPCALPLKSPVLVKVVIEAALHAFAAAEAEGLVYMKPGNLVFFQSTEARIDIKPSNVLLSDINGPSPRAEMGDLGLSTS